MSKTFAELTTELWSTGKCPYCPYVINAFRHSWLGNRTQLVGKEDPAALKSELDRFMDGVEPLDRELADLVDGIQRLGTLDRERLVGYLAFKQHTFHEIAKRTSGSIREELTAAGIDVGDAEKVAYAIYKRHREQYDAATEVVVLSPRAQALKGLAQRDRSVSLRRCTLSHDDFPVYASAIAKNTFLCALDLSGNNIHTIWARQLAAVLPELPNLHTLLLAGNALQPAGIAAVCGALEGRFLEALDLASNNGGASMGHSVGLVSVRSLNVAGNDLGADGAVALTPAARRCVTLDISMNGIQDGAPLAQLISTCDVLTRIDIGFNPLKDGATEVMATLRAHPALTSIDAIGCGISDADAEALVNERTQVTHLRYSPSPSELVQASLVANVEHLGVFRAALTSTPIPSWSSEDVYNALVLLLKRRDIAMQAPVDGQALTQLLRLDSVADWRVLCEFLDQFQ